MAKPRWFETDEPTNRRQCPCCDYLSLPGLSRDGAYYICPICRWEDDGHELDAVDDESIVNQNLTLRQARANFVEFGAADQSRVDNALPLPERSRFVHRPRFIS